MKGYKGYSKGLICLGKQYAENAEFEESNTEMCKCGMHFCENPLDVLKYYPPVNNEGNLNEYTEVEAPDECVKRDGDKCVTTKLSVGRKITLNELCKAAVAITKKGATNTGNWSAATNTGDYSAAINMGNCSTATNTGNWSTATNTGDYSAAINMGNCSTATNTGNWSTATNTGNYSAAINTGNCSAAINTGNCSVSEASGKDCFAIVTGVNGKAKGALGCYIAIAEWGFDGSAAEYVLVNFKTHIVDGKKIKPDTFYKLTDGKFVEAE